MKLTTTFNVKGASRELPLQDCWDFPAKTNEEERDILDRMALAISVRMDHCANNLLNNNSGVKYNDGMHVVFEDCTRFSRRAYEAMKRLLSIFHSVETCYEVCLEATPLMILQLIKAVGTDEELLNIALELLNAVIQKWTQERSGWHYLNKNSF